MKIRIFQINPERDIDHIKFQSTKWLFSHAGYTHLTPYIYDKVFEGKVAAQSLEDVYFLFNADNRPNAMTMRSMSISDVIAVDSSETVLSGFYYCDAVGFTRVEFDADQAKEALHGKATH